MSINNISASLIQSATRKLISMDAEAVKKLAPLNQKTIQIQIEDFQLSYYFSFNNEILSVSEINPIKEQQPSAAIKGKLSAFLAAANSQHSADSIFKGELHFSGEVSAAKKFQEFAQSLDIDWQEPLAQVLGDPIAHILTKGLQSLTSWVGQTHQSTRQDISEYLQEEIKITPPKAEQQIFFSQVDQIRSKADRLAARVKKLERTTSDTFGEPQQSLNPVILGE
jgi:ubiquinone biosynthesis accessory factor UbiJ